MTHEIIRVHDGTGAGSQNNEALKENFKGYSLEDLRYQRALVALKRDFAKAKIINKVDKARKHKLTGSTGNMSHIARVGGIASRIFSGLNYLDYAMLGMSIFSSGRKVYKFFRGKKKSNS